MYFRNTNNLNVLQLVEKEQREKCQINWDEKPDTICWCGYPYDGYPHGGTKCQKPNVLNRFILWLRS